MRLLMWGIVIACAVAAFVVAIDKGPEAIERLEEEGKAKTAEMMAKVPERRVNHGRFLLDNALYFVSEDADLCFMFMYRTDSSWQPELIIPVDCRDIPEGEVLLH